ncbi:MAG: hypothetical protein U1E83_01190 [Methylotetracoccus sp.]
MLLIAFVLLLAASGAQAQPFLTSDPYPASSTPKPTHCGVYLDTAAKAEFTVVADASGTYCKVDMASVATGSHTVKLSYIVKDPTWGSLEGPLSSPFAFVRPIGLGSAPTGLGLSP